MRTVLALGLLALLAGCSSATPAQEAQAIDAGPDATRALTEAGVMPAEAGGQPDASPPEPDAGVPLDAGIADAAMPPPCCSECAADLAGCQACEAECMESGVNDADAWGDAGTCHWLCMPSAPGCDYSVCFSLCVACDGG